MKKPPFYKSLLYSIKGIFWMLKSERNFQLEVFALIINLFLIVYFKLNSTDVALILLVCFLVLIAETINTAIEKICDFVEPNFNKKIGIIKRYFCWSSNSSYSTFYYCRSFSLQQIFFLLIYFQSLFIHHKNAISI